MKVKILSYTKNPELLVATAAKLCYSKSNIDDLEKKQTPEEIQKFIKRLMNMGHESPLEHVSFTFAIEGVSRITEQQLTRHRIASYSIQSGRYVDRDNAEFYTPSIIQENKSAANIYNDVCEQSKNSYKEIAKIIEFELCLRECEKRNIEVYANNPIKALQDFDKAEQRKIHKIAIENARCVFPNSLETRIICTMNVRSLLNFFSHRCCFRAQEEIRELANKMLILVKKIAPTTFKNAGATCKALGYCPEGNMQCEQLKDTVPTLDELLELYFENKKNNK